MGDFAAGKMLDPVSVLLQLIEQKAPELHEMLQPVPPATADALATAPAALRPFLAAHDGGWEIYEYVLCSCAEMAPSAAGLAIANHKFDEGDKLCLDEANAACTMCTRSLRRACAAYVRGWTGSWAGTRVPRAAPSAPRKRGPRGFGSARGCRLCAVWAVRGGDGPPGRHASVPHGRHASHCAVLPAGHGRAGARERRRHDGTRARLR